MKYALLFLLISNVAFAQNLKSTSVYFDVDQSQTNQLSSTDPKSFLDKVPVNSKIIRIEAYCDTNGSTAYNVKLAQRRLNTVSEFMKLLPYNMETAEMTPYGESTNKGPRLSLEQSRRVDIFYVEPAIKIEPPIEIVAPEEPAPVELNLEFAEESSPPQLAPVSDGEFSKEAIGNFVEADDNELRLDMNILFVNISDMILPESEPQLKDLLKIMKQYPELKAEIHGHVCCTVNYELSEARARVVYLYLAQNKIDPARLSYLGHSNDQPKVWPELTENDRKQNRRVTVVFSK